MGKRKHINFVVFSKKRLITVIVCILSVLVVCVFPNVQITTSPQTKYTIVVDAGHGGVDVK